MFKYEYDNSIIRKVKFSKWYLLDVSVLFSLVYSLPFLFIVVYVKTSLLPIIFIIGELLFILVDLFFVVLHINIFRFSIEISEKEICFKCFFKKTSLKKDEIQTLGIIKRAGTALSINPYTTSTVYFSKDKVDVSKLYKSLWEKHIVGCGVINQNVIFVSGYSKFLLEFYLIFWEMFKTSTSVTINNNDRSDFHIN